MNTEEWALIVGRLVVEHQQVKQDVAFMEVRLWREGELLRVAADAAISHVSPDVNPCNYTNHEDLQKLFIEYYTLREKLDKLTKQKEKLGI